MAIKVVNTINNQEQIDALIQAINHADICVLYQTKDLVFQWAKNLPMSLKKRWSVGCTDSDLFDSTIARQMMELKKTALLNGAGAVFEAKISGGEKPIWLKLSIDCHHDENGDIIGLITTGINVSEVRQREQILNILLREVSHRSKNLLAIMQSIAGQTARFSDNVSEFLLKYQGRIQSLSHSQDLVTDSNWRGALFQDLIDAQASGYIDHSPGNFIVEGRNPYLFPGAALHIGLAFHELIINSSSYGALSSDCGYVKINCALKNDKNKGNFIEITWQEEYSCNKNKNESYARFGSTVLEKIVPIAVDGTAKYEIDNGKVNYTLNVPETNFDL